MCGSQAALAMLGQLLPSRVGLGDPWVGPMKFPAVVSQVSLAGGTAAGVAAFWQVTQV